MDLAVNIKFCSLHIAFNVNDRFRLDDNDKDQARGLIFKLQAVTTHIQYENVLREVREKLPQPIQTGTEKEEYVDD